MMISGGSPSGVSVSVQSLAQEKGVLFMVGMTLSTKTAGKDKRRYGCSHFFYTHMSGVALGLVLAAEYGKDRRPTT